LLSPLPELPGRREKRGRRRGRGRGGVLGRCPGWMSTSDAPGFRRPVLAGGGGYTGPPSTRFRRLQTRPRRENNRTTPETCPRQHPHACFSGRRRRTPIPHTHEKAAFRVSSHARRGRRPADGLTVPRLNFCRWRPIGEGPNRHSVSGESSGRVRDGCRRPSRRLECWCTTLGPRRWRPGRRTSAPPEPGAAGHAEYPAHSGNGLPPVPAIGATPPQQSGEKKVVRSGPVGAGTVLGTASTRA